MKKKNVEKEGEATMTIASSDELRAIFMPKTRSILTDTQISRRLGISEEAARGLIKAAFPSVLSEELTDQSAYYP
jgi:hypothetical protein